MRRRSIGSVTRRRRPWEQEVGGPLSPDWVVGGLVVAILVAGALGFRFNDRYAKGYGIFAR